MVYKDSVHALCSRYAKDLVSVSEPVFETEMCPDCVQHVLKDPEKRAKVFTRVVDGDPEDYAKGEPWISVWDKAHKQHEPVVVVGNLRIDLEI